MVSSTSLAGLVLLLSNTVFSPVSAFPGSPPVPAKLEVRAPYDAKVTPKPAPIPARFIPRAPASTHSNSTTGSVTKSSSRSSVSSSAAALTVPFGVTTTVISGTTYSLTYVATTAAKPTTIVESNAQTTTTATYSAGAPIWFIPILPPGFPLPPPFPPPIPPPPPPGGGGGGGGGGSGCEFGCEDDNNPSGSQGSEKPPSSTQKPQTSTTASSSSASTSSSSSAGNLCSAGCSICQLGRREAAAAATPRPKREVGTLMLDAAKLVRRDVPGTGGVNDGVAETYGEVARLGNTLEVDLATGGVNGGVIQVGVSSSQFTAFDNAEHNVYVHGLEGCTSVIVVSRLGTWASHFWEAPGFTGGAAQFQTDVIGYLQSNLGGHAATFGDAATTKIFIMTPAPETSDINGSGPSGSGTTSQGTQKYPAQVGQIISALGGIVPGVNPQTFVYAVQRNPTYLGTGVYGKAMILYSNAQSEDPDPQGMMDLWNPPHNAYQVWTQGLLIGHDDWIPCAAGSKRDGSSCPISRSSSIASNTASSTGSKTASSSSSAVSSTGSKTASPSISSTRSSAVSSTASSTAPKTTTLSTSTSSSRTIPPPQTRTANCNVCVLPYGSNDPECTPIPGCGVSTTTSSAPPVVTWPGCGTTNVKGFTCDNNCRGFVDCQPWCVDLCAYCFNANDVC